MVAEAFRPLTRLLPTPVQILPASGSLTLDDTVHYRIDSPGAAPRLQRALERFGQPFDLRFLPGGAGKLTLRLQSPETAYPQTDTDESYRLTIGSSGIHIDADSSYGAMHALTTLGQLLQQGLTLPCAKITDTPRFAWRGLMLDVVRHWLPPEVIRRQLDAMAACKLNVLHWHLSDDQGFRVESRRYPDLHEKGSDGNYYTQGELQGLIDFAADRGIRVVPEFDLPGHSRSWQIAYPQLASAPGKPLYLYHQKGLFSDPLDPSTEANLTLIDGVITEMSELFPDACFHMGGDETMLGAWKRNKRIKSAMRENNEPDVQAYKAWFIRHYAALLQTLGKTPLGWDEVAGDGLPAGAMICKWRSKTISRDEQQYPVVATAGFYLDHMQTAWQHYRNDPADWPNADAARLVGGEACNWAESVDPSNIDQRVWPRTLAIAEVLWSSRNDTQKTSQSALYERLRHHSTQLGTICRHEGHLERWCRQTLNAEAAEPVIRLASLCTPELYSQIMIQLPRMLPWPLGHWRKPLRDEPLPVDRLIHHLYPESPAAQRFNQAVEDYLAKPDADRANALRQTLHQWRDNDEALKAVLDQCEPLGEPGLVHLSDALKQLAQAGLAALEVVDSGETRDLAQAQKAVRRTAYTDAEMTTDWFKAFALDWRWLTQARVHRLIRLSVQRGIARLVAAAAPKD